jgi:hypothetical protein
MASYQAEGRFTEFFRDLAVAGRALSSYPPGHPAVAGSLAKVHEALSSLLEETGPIEIAAARDALLWSDRRFTSPPAAQLAKLLRRRRAAGIFLDPGVSVGELETFLRALALDPRSARAAGSLAAELNAAGLVRLHVSDLDFSSLALVEDDEETSAPEAGAFSSRVARRLLASGSVPADRLAAWIASGKSAADLLQLLFESRGNSSETGSWGPAAFAAALNAVAEEKAAAEEKGELPDGEPAAAREAPVDRGMGEAAAPRGAAPRIHPRQLATLRQAFATEDIDTLRDSGTATGDLAALLDLQEDPTALALSQAAEKIGRELGDPVLEGDASARLLELAERVEVPVEVCSRILQRFEKGYVRLLSGGRVRQASALVERVQRGAEREGPVGEAFRSTAGRMSDRESIEALVASLTEVPDEAFEAVPALIEQFGPAAVRHLLDILARTENRRMRFRLLDLLAKLGPVVARDASALLSDPRWYVVRNMLLLLRRVGDSRSVLAVRRCVDHPDLRVRLEAIHTLFAFDREVPRELLRRALHDPDLRQAEAAMELAGKYVIAEAVEPIVAYLAAWDPFGKRRAVRLKAIRALAAIGDPAALAGLGRFRSRYALPQPALEERRELFRTLPAYPEESYQAWIESGLRSRDPEIRRLCAAMGPGPGGAR